MENDETLIKVGITTGDFNGIGMEVIIKSLLDSAILKSFTPIVYGSSKVASYHRKALNINDFSFNLIKSADLASSKHVNLINCWEEEVKLELGISSTVAGQKSLQSIDAAIEDLKKGLIDVLVTAPINKHNIQSEQFKFAGHTEYLAQKFDAKDHLMMLVSDKLRIGIVTEHLPISAVSQAIAAEKIISKLKTLNTSLQVDFGIRKPRIAVLGLNPHAGDGGVIGKEEIEIITPAINKVKEIGIMAFGPYAADGFFGAGTYTQFDAVLAMYHDQALIPFKFLSFHDGVNFTAGLPIVRTSPDHGTGYDIAGHNKAYETSFREALFLACDIFKRRNINKELTANPLKISHQKREH